VYIIQDEKETDSRNKAIKIFQYHKKSFVDVIFRHYKFLEKNRTIINLCEEQMQKEQISLPEIKLIGISVRTSFEQELDKMKGNIFPCVKKYFHEALHEKIFHRKKPGTTYCAYTDYDTDYKGEYTYFIGEQVSFFDPALEERGFQKLIIPAQQYMKLTNGPAPMPDVVVDAWEKIWEMTPEALGGKRGYNTDFEIYDERAANHQNIILDVFVGIES